MTLLLDPFDRAALIFDERQFRPVPMHCSPCARVACRRASKAKDDGRLPMTDHNTRIFVVGTNGNEARAVAEAIVHDAFHNVIFFGGAITDLPELLEDEEL